MSQEVTTFTSVDAPGSTTQPRIPVDCVANEHRPEPSYGGGCAPGTYRCGENYCTPDGAVCCASVGYPEYNCQSGTTCCPDGTCSVGSCDGSSSNSGGESCDGGSDCGDYCCGAGQVCGAVGSGRCCGAETPYHCPEIGQCTSDPVGCDATTGTGGSTSSSTPGAYECFSIDSAGQCSQTSYCQNANDMCDGYYEGDGVRFDCGDACSQAGLNACAQALADYCVNGSTATGDATSDSSEDGGGGCAIGTPGDTSITALFVALAILVGRKAQRRVRCRPSHPTSDAR